MRRILRTIPRTTRNRSHSSAAAAAPAVMPLLPSRSTTRIPSPGYGQPLPSTHPRLFGASNELTPGITAAEYEGRRKKLMDGLEEGSMVIVAGGRMKYMSAQILYAPPILLHR